jgi:hypothetical protein
MSQVRWETTWIFPKPRRTFHLITAWCPAFIGDENANCAPASHWSSTMQRRRFKHILSFPDRLAEDAERLRAEAEKLPHERDLLLREARQTETAAHVNERLTSPGLSPPK